MKKSGFILALLAIILSPPVAAQTSMEHLYSTLSGKNAILCSDPYNEGSIICYNDQVNYMPYTFIYHDQLGTSTFCYHSSSGIPNTNTPDGFNVKDIEIVGNYCYFCGTYYIYYFEYLIGGGLMLVTTETGYIGRFLLSDIVSGVSPMPIQFCLIPGTKVFSKLKGFVNKTNNYICLIGMGSAGNSCLATVRENGTGIAYGVHHIADASETLTDLTLTDKYLVTVSRFDGKPYNYGLRGERRNNIVSALASSTPLPMFDYLNTCNTSNVNTIDNPRPENPTFHTNEVEMKISNVKGEDHVVVGYDCVSVGLDVDCYTDKYHTDLFYIEHDMYNPGQNNGMIIVNAQMVTKSQQKDNTLTGLACPDPSTPTILLHNYSANTNEGSGEIQFPSWIAFGQMENLTIDYREVQDMYLDNVYQKAVFTGVLQNTSNIIHFQQDYYNSGGSCYSTTPKAFSEQMTLPENEVEPTEVETLYSTLDWGRTLQRPSQKVTYDIDCKTN